jgi:hypothetical protein
MKRIILRTVSQPGWAMMFCPPSLLKKRNKAALVLLDGGGFFV